MIAVASHVTCLKAAAGTVANLHNTMSNMQAEENPASSWGGAGCGVGLYSSAERELVEPLATAAGAFALASGTRAPHNHGGGPWDMYKLTAALGATDGGLFTQGPNFLG